MPAAWHARPCIFATTPHTSGVDDRFWLWPGLCLRGSNAIRCLGSIQDVMAYVNRIIFAFRIVWLIDRFLFCAREQREKIFALCVAV